MSLRDRVGRIRSRIEQAAVNQVKAAEAEYQRLQTAVAGGDETVTAADLAEAKAAIELAELKVQNARRVAAEEAEAAHRRAIEAFVEQATATVPMTSDLNQAVTEARSQAVVALLKLYEAAQDHRDTVTALVQAGAGLGLDEHNEHGVRVRTQSDAIAVRVGRDEAHDVDPVARVAQAVAAVLGESSHPLAIEANRYSSAANRVDVGDVVHIPVLSPQQQYARNARRHRASIVASQRAQREAEERHRATTPPDRRGSF